MPSDALDILPLRGVRSSTATVQSLENGFEGAKRWRGTNHFKRPLLAVETAEQLAAEMTFPDIIFAEKQQILGHAASPITKKGSRLAVGVCGTAKPRLAGATSHSRTLATDAMGDNRSSPCSPSTTLV